MTLEVPPDLAGQSSLYTTSDPLLKRLRLQDSTGNDITDIERYFKNKDVLVFYAGSEGGSNNLKRFHLDLTSFAVRHLKTCNVIYVSTDTSAEAAKRVMSGQAFLQMAFHDNSDFAEVASAADLSAAARRRKGAEVEEVKRGEDFITAGEIEIGAEAVTLGEDANPYDYVRPLSRAALTALMRAYSTPSIAVYHIPSHTFIARNVRMTSFASDQIEKNYHTWQNGGTPSLRLRDIIYPLRWWFLLLIAAVSYRLFLIVFGNEYNMIPVFIDRMLQSTR